MIIGITGTDGAGKGSVVEYLVEQKGFVHYSARGLITAQIQAQGLPVTRENMRLVANQMRKEHGLDVIVQSALQKMQVDGATNVIVESIRALKEVETLHQAGGILLAVDAEQKLRFERITARQSESDAVSFAQFLEQEQIEMNDPDPHGMQKAKVIEQADYVILNEGTLAELGEQVEQFLQSVHE